MGKAKRIIIAAVAVAVVAGGAIWYGATSSKNAGAPSVKSTTDSPAASDSDTTGIASVITYDGNGFTLSADEVNSGDKVRVVNSSTSELEFDSDPHPVHTDNTELNAGLIPAGEEREFTLTTKGTWGFHNHQNAGQSGKISVR